MLKGRNGLIAAVILTASAGAMVFYTLRPGDMTPAETAAALTSQPQPMESASYDSGVPQREAPASPRATGSKRLSAPEPDAMVEDQTQDPIKKPKKRRKTRRTKRRPRRAAESQTNPEDFKPPEDDDISISGKAIRP